MTDKVTIFTEEEGELWGVFVYGHVEPSSILEDVNAKLREFDVDPVPLSKIKRRFMAKNVEEYGDEFPWELLRDGATGNGATAITGYFP